MRAERVTLVMLVLLVGCPSKRAASPATSAEVAPPPGEARSQIDALAEAEKELAANAAELNALGVKIAWGRRDKNTGEPGRATEPSVEPETPTPGTPTIGPKQPSHSDPRKKPEDVKPSPKPAPKNTKDDVPGGEPAASNETPCQKICTLASVACDLSKRICQLADDHQGDARYEDACWNAGRQCEDASDACSDCTAC